MITILNSSILTEFGCYEYFQVSLDEARRLIKRDHQGEYLSAIGHPATAEILTELLGIPVALNPIEYRQRQGNEALVFKLKTRVRVPEGTILNREETEEIGYDFGLLRRTF